MPGLLPTNTGLTPGRKGLRPSRGGGQCPPGYIIVIQASKVSETLSTCTIQLSYITQLPVGVAVVSQTWELNPPFTTSTQASPIHAYDRTAPPFTATLSIDTSDGATCEATEIFFCDIECGYLDWLQHRNAFATWIPMTGPCSGLSGAVIMVQQPCLWRFQTVISNQIIIAEFNIGTFQFQTVGTLTFTTIVIPNTDSDPASTVTYRSGPIAGEVLPASVDLTLSSTQLGATVCSFVDPPPATRTVTLGLNARSPEAKRATIARRVFIRCRIALKPNRCGIVPGRCASIWDGRRSVTG